jgi:FG-GAP-like repeat
LSAAALIAAGTYWAWSEADTGTAAAVPNSSEDAENGLTADERQYLWEIENRAFQITYKVGPAFSAALAADDRSAVADFLHPEFTGTVFDHQSAEVFERGFATFRYSRASNHGTRTVAGEPFADWLLEQVRWFAATPRIQLTLLYLSPVNRRELSGGWKGTIILRMSGEAAASGGVPSLHGDSATKDTKDLFPTRYTVGGGEPLEITIRGEFQSDSLPDNPANAHGWIRSWGVDELSVNHARNLLMEEIAAPSAGIDTETLHDNWKCSRESFLATPGGVYACDYNRDGITDLLVTDRGFPMLFAGRGDARFEDVTVQAGLPWGKDRSSVAAFADLDNDGDEDLILGVVILENDHGRFVSRGRLPLTPETTGIAVADYDGDGLVDLYVSNAAPTPERAGVVARVSWVDDNSGTPNALWRNLGAFKFENVTEAANAGAGRRSTFTSLWLDADDDGKPDLYVINELGPNVLLHNEGNGTFKECQIGPAFDGFTMGAAVGDINDDGRIDIYLANMKSKVGQRIVANLPPDAYPPEIIDKMRRWVAGNFLLYNRGNLEFAEGNRSTAGGGWSYGPVLADLDGDGHLDIHTTCGFASFSRQEPDG